MSGRDGTPPRRRPTPLNDLGSDAEPVGSGASDFVPAERLAGLGIAGLSRRRIAVAVGLVVVAWIAVALGRQLGAAGAAQARAEALAAEVARRSAEVAALEAELAQIQDPVYVRQEARGYGLGAPNEIRFALDPAAAPLPPNAPGSAATRLGEIVERPSPLEVWLTILFGPDPGG
mgnify:CR=1 FL=1